MGEEGPGHEGGVHGGPDGEGAITTHDATVSGGQSGPGGAHQNVAQMQVSFVCT